MWGWCQAARKVHGTEIAQPGCPSSRTDVGEDGSIAKPPEWTQSLPIPLPEPHTLGVSWFPPPHSHPRCFLSCFSKAPKRCGEERGCRRVCIQPRVQRRSTAPKNSGARKQKEGSKLVSVLTPTTPFLHPRFSTRGDRQRRALTAPAVYPGSPKTHSRACSRGDSEPWSFPGVFESLIFRVSHLLPPETFPTPDFNSTPPEPVPPVRQHGELNATSQRVPEHPCCRSIGVTPSRWRTTRQPQKLTPDESGWAEGGGTGEPIKPARKIRSPKEKSVRSTVPAWGQTCPTAQVSFWQRQPRMSPRQGMVGAHWAPHQLGMAQPHLRSPGEGDFMLSSKKRHQK